MLKTRIELVTGFISSGKTTWINTFLQSTWVPNEKIVVLQLEKGQEELNLSHLQQVAIHCLTQLELTITVECFSDLLNRYQPDRLIVECNGMSNLEELLFVLNDVSIKKKAFISTIFNLIDASSFSTYWQNLKTFLKPALSNSHMIIINRTHLINAEKKQDLKNTIQQYNKHAYILWIDDVEHMANAIQRCYLLDKGWLKTIRIYSRKVIRKLRDKMEKT